MPMEGFCALCLSDFMEGKRGMVPWKWLWWGLVRFAYSEGGLEEVEFVLKCSFFEQNFLPESGSQDSRRRKIENKHILFRYTDKSAELCILITSKATAIWETIITMTQSKGMWTF